MLLAIISRGLHCSAIGIQENIALKPLVIRIGIALLAAWYTFCRLFSTKRQIVCISRQSNCPPVDFCLIRDYFQQKHPDWRVVILAHTLENPVAYLPIMLRQVFYMATSRAVVLDSYCIAASLLSSRIKAPVIQIWHALGNMKKFGYTALDTGEGRSSATARLMHMHEGYDAVAVSSFSFARDLAAGFNVEEDILFEAPLPRTDLLTDPEHRRKQREAFARAHPQTTQRKVIVYCPTFRKEQSDNEDAAMAALTDAVDFDRYCLVFKPHPVSKQVIEDPRVITIRGGDIDPLYSADYVISDYSTVMYEAGLLQAPVFLYAYDWCEYHGKRSFNIDLEHDIPTLFTDDPRAIMDAIESDAFDHDAFQTFVRRNIALPPRGTCTEQLCEHILALAEKPVR